MVKNVRRALRFIKSVILYFYYLPINFFIRPATTIIPKTVIIIRPDSIGDYILFRDFVQLFKTSQKYREYSVTLIGNECYRDLALALDQTYVDHFIWINRSKMVRNLFYRYKILKSITGKGYNLLINPVYCRGFFLDDTISKFIQAREKISLTPHPTFNLQWQNRKSRHFYTRIVEIKPNIFEFERNRQFFVTFFDHACLPVKPVMETSHTYSGPSLPPQFFLIALGAGHPKREWAAENYAKVAQRLIEQYEIPCVLTGTESDTGKARNIQDILLEKCTNLVGRCSLADLPHIVQRAHFIICNESSVAHIAVSLEKKCIVISNGNDFGRFTPYPQDMAPDYRVIYPPSIHNTETSYPQNVEKYGNGSQESINSIRPETVIQQCLEFSHAF